MTKITVLSFLSPFISTEITRLLIKDRKLTRGNLCFYRWTTTDTKQYTTSGRIISIPSYTTK